MDKERERERRRDGGLCGIREMGDLFRYIIFVLVLPIVCECISEDVPQNILTIAQPSIEIEMHLSEIHGTGDNLSQCRTEGIAHVQLQFCEMPLECSVDASTV